jgi:hypothetical protein
MKLLNEETNKLNTNIIQASASSDELAKALNRLTKYGAIVVFLGVIVAAVNLGFDIYKHFNPPPINVSGTLSPAPRGR